MNTANHWIRIIIFSILIIGVYSGCNNQRDSDHASNPIGVVSSAHPLATEAGIKILKEGGNAFDAAVTIAATLNVVEPMMSGMGGYGTILIYDAGKKQIRFLDSSGKIPLNTNSDLMRPPTPDYLRNRRGAKAVSTPGNVNAWFAMSESYGNLEWKSLFIEPIKIAESGFLVSSRLSRFIKGSFHTYSPYTQSFYGKDGVPLKVGEQLVQKDLGASMRMIAKNGVEAFYKGFIANAIDKAMNEKEGFLSYQDLANDEAEWWEPIDIDYRGYKIYTASPPSTAFPALIRIGLMENFQFQEHNSVEYLHAFAEATKFAYASRLKYAGDPEIKPPPLQKLLSETYLKSTAENFDPLVASDFQMPSNKSEESKNTTHFVVADQWGNIVSATQTLGNLFGSRIMPEGTGIWLNNSLAYCTYEPKGNPMDAIPGQRKLSGDCPTIIFKEGRPWVALGTPGGHTIGQTVPQMVMNLVDFNMDLQEAIDAPRVSFIEPSSLAVESDIAENTFRELSKRGHKVTRVKGLGNAHALKLLFDNDGNLTGFEGASDKRGEGLAEVLR